MSQSSDGNVRGRQGRGVWVPSLLLVVSVLLAGCATGSVPVTRDSSLPELLLTLDSSEKMGGDPACRDRTVKTTEVLGAVEQGRKGESSRWTERWTVDRCGTSVPYIVKFARSATGDMDVTMQLEKPVGQVTPVPGKTLADPVLQRDTIGFLSQRDFTDATAVEAACPARSVINTEIVQPLEGGTVKDGRPLEGRWAERWTLDRCGKPVRYLVRFNTTAKGTTFTAEREP